MSAFALRLAFDVQADVAVERCRVLRKLGGRRAMHDHSALQHHRVFGERQRHLGALLDQNDGGAFLNNPELRKEFLAPSISGDYVACLGVSETGAGSDVASIKTNARRVGGDWVINGGKMWTTNGAQADWMCVLANTGDGQAHKNKSLIVVPMKTKGVEIVKKLDKLGMRASDTVQTFFDERMHLNKFMGSGGLASAIDEFNADHFDHAGLGFIGGAYHIVSSVGGQPIHGAAPEAVHFPGGLGGVLSEAHAPGGRKRGLRAVVTAGE